RHLHRDPFAAAAGRLLLRSRWRRHRHAQRSRPRAAGDGAEAAGSARGAGDGGGRDEVAGRGGNAAGGGAMTAARVFVLDHKDSFVFLLGEQFARRGAEVRTLRTDLPLPLLQQRVTEFAPHLVVLSPGPGRPEDAATTVAWLRTGPDLPLLGVCLGHQALAVACGGEVGRAPEPAHGVGTELALADDP